MKMGSLPSEADSWKQQRRKCVHFVPKVNFIGHIPLSEEIGKKSYGKSYTSTKMPANTYISIGDLCGDDWWSYCPLL